MRFVLIWILCEMSMCEYFLLYNKSKSICDVFCVCVVSPDCLPLPGFLGEKNVMAPQYSPDTNTHAIVTQLWLRWFGATHQCGRHSLEKSFKFHVSSHMIHIQWRPVNLERLMIGTEKTWTWIQWVFAMFSFTSIIDKINNHCISHRWTRMNNVMLGRVRPIVYIFERMDQN